MRGASGRSATDFSRAVSAAALRSFSGRSTMGCVANSTGTEVLLQLEALRSAAQLSQLFGLTERKKVRLEQKKPLPTSVRLVMIIPKVEIIKRNIIVLITGV